jgi:3-isopropylmalate dehydrogenase
VVVTENLFGDIITDLGAAVQGGMGLATSGNLDPTRRRPSMFEPVHGSAPDIVGTGKADPTAAVMAVGMMLDFLGESGAAKRVDAAVAAWLTERGSNADRLGYSTQQIGDRLAELAGS